MSHVLLEGLTNKLILTIPGLDGSGPDHWQSLWEDRLLNCERVAMDDWVFPRKDQWIDKLDHSIRSASGPVVLVAHSLGCTAVAWWAQLRWSIDLREKLIGALLVAPPNLQRPDAPDRIRNFGPTPSELLPFRSILVASRDDPYARFDSLKRMAYFWGSQLVDVGEAGHINAQSGLGSWDEGLSLVSSLVAQWQPTLFAVTRGTVSVPNRATARPDLCWGD